MSFAVLGRHTKATALAFSFSLASCVALVEREFLYMQSVTVNSFAHSFFYNSQCYRPIEIIINIDR